MSQDTVLISVALSQAVKFIYFQVTSSYLYVLDQLNQSTSNILSEVMSRLLSRFRCILFPSNQV